MWSLGYLILFGDPRYTVVPTPEDHGKCVRSLSWTTLGVGVGDDEEGNGKVGDGTRGGDEGGGTDPGRKKRGVVNAPKDHDLPFPRTKVRVVRLSSGTSLQKTLNLGLEPELCQVYSSGRGSIRSGGRESYDLSFGPSTNEVVWGRDTLNRKRRSLSDLTSPERSLSRGNIACNVPGTGYG